MRNNTNAEQIMTKRAKVIFIFSLVLWCVLIARLITLQVFQYDKYKSQVLSNVQKTSSSKATRGEIYDSSMNKLASNYTVYRIFISPHDIEKEDERKIAQGLSEILGVDYGSILTKAQKKNRYDETIVKKATEEQALAVQEFKKTNGYTQQIYLEANQDRYYPYGSLASHVIGVVGVDGGLTGLEYYYDDYLTGEGGKIIIAKDATGNPIYSGYEKYIDASNGANLITTIKMQIQNALEEQVKAAYENAQPLGRACGVVMDCSTGAVLGMSTYPTFDLNNPFVLDEKSQEALDSSGFEPGSDEYASYQAELLYTHWRNKVVTEMYEPGSTFKPITTAGAIEEGVITFDDHLVCEGSYEGISCFKRRGHGEVEFRVGLQQSCNPCLMQVGVRLGTEKFMKYFEAFGYKEKTGIDLPGEGGSIYHPASQFTDKAMLYYCFGQTFKVTPIRHATSLAAIANGGYLVQPYVVDRIIDNDGKILFQHDSTPIRQVVSRSVCEQIWQVLEEGTSGDGQAKNAKVRGYKIAAKTGTSEILDEFDEDGNATYVIGSTMAFAPADNPQIVALIAVDKPTCEQKYGGMTAAPFIANLMDEIMPVLGVDRIYSENDIKSLSRYVSKVKGWPIAEGIKMMTRNGLDYKVIGNGEVIQYQVPAAGERLMVNQGTVYLYTGGETPEYNIQVPNVIGKKVTVASKTLESLGFNIIVNGAVNDKSSTEAYVISQSMEAGSYGTKGNDTTTTEIYTDTVA